jgi:hypothetical protein
MSYTLSMTSGAFLLGIMVSAYSGIPTAVLESVTSFALLGFIVSSAVYLWVTRRGDRER